MRAGECGTRPAEGTRTDERIVWQRIASCMASREAGVPPNYTVGLGTTYCEGGCTFMASWVGEKPTKLDRVIERQKRRKRQIRLRGRTWGDRTALETLQSRVGWTQGAPKDHRLW